MSRCESDKERLRGERAAGPGSDGKETARACAVYTATKMNKRMNE